MDFEKRISDYGMTPEQYEASFAEITAKVQGNSDKDWTEIIDQYSIPLSRNTLRNACSNVYGSVFVKEYFDEKRRKEMEVNSEPITDEPAPLSLPRYKEQTDVNKDGSFTSDRLIEINEENLKNPEFLLNAHGYDPLEWELVSARNSIWNQCGKSGVKNLYASKINVKPRTEISITLNKIEEFFNRLDRYYSKPKILKNNFYLDGDKLLLVDIADLHMNLQATLFSTNNEYNCEIAEKLFFYVIEDILSRTEKYNFKEIIFCIGGDMLNGDNLSGTTTKGTPQNSDIHYYDAYEKLCSMVIKAIDILKERCKVSVIYVMGNHDELTGFKLAKYVDAWFRDDNNVEVDYQPLPRKYKVFGKTLFCFAHDGDIKKLPMLIADEAREFWSKVDTTEVFLQHLHTEQILLEDNNIRIQRLPTISAKSKWSNDKGYSSKRQCKSFIFDFNDGLTDILYTPIKNV